MLAPTLSWDAMKMHLPLSQYYLQVHALEPKPGLDYSFFPQAAESLFALAWSLGGQPAAQLIAPLFFALSLLAAWVLARECGADSGEALAGVLLVASLPVVHWAESVPKNDAVVTFFMLASLIAALRWRATSEFKWVQAGVLFLACGFATKDLACSGAIPLAFVFLPAAWREPRRLRAFASLAMIFAIVALIWNVRRFVLTGNPIFPLAPGKAMVPGWPPDPSLGGTILRILRLPWDLQFHGHDFSETVLIAPLGIAFVLFWPMWLLHAASQPCGAAVSVVRNRELPPVGMAEPTGALRGAGANRIRAAHRRQARPFLAGLARSSREQAWRPPLYGS